MSATKHKAEASHADNWRKQSDVVTHNDVINAYIKGKEAGRDEAKLAMRKLFNDNLEKAQSKSEELLLALKKIGVTVDTMHIKADTITTFNTLLITTHDDYVSEKMLTAIKKGRELKTKTDSDDFNINFYFTYRADSLNQGCIESDGYFLRYNANA